MEEGFRVVVKGAARDELLAIAYYVADKYGLRYGARLEDKLEKAVYALSSVPKQHTRPRYLIGRQFVYRRVLVGEKHRVIFTLDEYARRIDVVRVDVVRVDLQSSDPATLDDLP